MDRADRTTSTESTPERSAADRDLARDPERALEAEHSEDAPNPPRTTTGRMTAPKFGSATSGGGELEPGPERD